MWRDPYTVDVRDERYDSETEEIPNQVERVGWSCRDYQRLQIDQEDKGRRLVA